MAKHVQPEVPREVRLRRLKDSYRILAVKDNLATCPYCTPLFVGGYVHSLNCKLTPPEEETLEKQKETYYARFGRNVPEWDKGCSI